MLELRDFALLPQVERYIERLVAGDQGLIVVAGLDPRPWVPTALENGFLPSGRSTLFRILMRQVLAAQPLAQSIVVARTKDAIRVPRSLRHRVIHSLVDAHGSYAERIALAARRRPDLLVIDRLTAENAAAALEAALEGLRVLSQLDTVFRGEGVARHLVNLGVPQEHLGGLGWVLTVQRLPTLCPHCKEPSPSASAQLAELRSRHAWLEDWIEDGPFFRAKGCRHCRHTGRAGEIAAFDIWESGAPDPLPLEAYLLGLASQGHVPLDDVLHLEADLLRRTYNLLATSESALAAANTALERKRTELEAANRVLEQRTEAVISLESIGQALITSTSLGELAGQLCRHARDLCGADRAILYVFHPREDTAEVLAVYGWDPSLVHQVMEATLVSGADVGTGPTPFNQRPPGVPHSPTDLAATMLQAGLRVPLIAQDRLVGLMIVHTSRSLRFPPGQVALLQTFANQAALAIQRAGLTDALREKIAQLEAAQEELVQKERMERELELARQVQQSVLPHTFPLVPGYAFAARNEPARQVGGDFYDVILLDAHRFGLVIGDVSDKGMPAALYMALTRSLLLAEARRATSPGKVLINVHRLLLELGQPRMFVTMFYGVVDGPTGRLTYARAGHDRPLLLRQGQVQTLGGEGTLLGFPGLDDLHLTEEEIELRPGDRLVLYTDGLTDTLAPDGRAFGLGRLRSLLQTHTDLPPADLAAITFAELAAYRGTTEQFDDMTLLTMQVIGT